MKMDRFSRNSALMIAVLLLAALSATAQETAIVTPHQQAQLFSESGVAAPTLPSQQYFDELYNPTLREQRMIREARAAEAARRANQNAKAAAPQPTVRFGNTAYSEANFSPYPDRKLDARTLSFPMSRGTLQRAETKANQLRQTK